ncbi:MAG: M14 family metallopeptidase, partial [Thermoanaerobaculia bacterium]|nr:M14 family metallopeptidase [Thermoanaerobaculia bacterium]
PSEFLGYEPGARFTPQYRIIDYFETLAESEMLELEAYGETWEGRPLTLAVIGSPENVERLDEIRSNLDRISDPRETTLEEAKGLARSTPAVIWLAFGIHGNEPSSSEAAMVTARWLLSDEAAAVRENVLVLIDPLQNPDGRARYVNWFHQKLGNEPNPSPEAIEHREPWPGGRYNHYLLDMNRDWAWATQPETLGRIEVFSSWHPQVVVDVHEMGYESTYFFPPTSPPMHERIDPDVREWLQIFGEANAEVFNEKQWPFFVRESFDLFYPGYGDSWPSLRGAIGMTYEVAGHSRAGLIVERDDGSTWSLAERIEQHSTAAITTVKTTSRNHEALLMHTWSSARRAMLNPSTFLILPEGIASREAVDLLIRQRIEVSFLDEPLTRSATRIGSNRDRRQQKSFPAGTAVISTDQPLGEFAKTLLEQSPLLPPDFVDEQRERFDADEDTHFDDLTGWSVPLSYNVETWELDGLIRKELLTDRRPPSEGSFTPSSYGWLIDGLDPAVYRSAAALEKAGVRFGLIPDAFRVDEREFARGSISILRFKNVDDLEHILSKIAKEQGVEIVGVDKGWIGDLTLGSNSIRSYVEPDILLVGGSGTSATSFGALWHTLDVTVDVPHTVIDLDSLPEIDLDRYRVIVLPHGYRYEEILDTGVESELGDWIRGGGTLVAIKGAADALRGEEQGLTEVQTRSVQEEDESPSGSARYYEPSIPGAVFATEVRRRDHLSFGIHDSDPPVLLDGSTALELAPYAAANIVTISESDPLLAGLAWPESIEKIAGSAWLTSERVGRGRIITFADEPHYRLFWKGTLPFFLNAVMYTPSFLN